MLNAKRIGYVYKQPICIAAEAPAVIEASANAVDKVPFVYLSTLLKYTSRSLPKTTISAVDACCLSMHT